MIKSARFLSVIFLTLSFPVWASDLRNKEEPLEYYRKERTSDYEYAIKTSKEIYTELSNQGYPYAVEAASIVFPELLRYHEFQNDIESLFNELLAITSEESDGFSIGPMQMKPVFAVQVEKIIALNSVYRQRYSSINYNGDTSTVDARRKRLVRLNNLTLQMEYLKAFMDWEIEVLGLRSEDRETRIMYLSAAYNFGIQEFREKLKGLFNMETFPSGKRRLYFNYQKICLAAALKLTEEK